jgi:hypothetical protein
MTYINPMDPPDWFKEISPTEQVPLLKVVASSSWGITVEGLGTVPIALRINSLSFTQF